MNISVPNWDCVDLVAVAQALTVNARIPVKVNLGTRYNTACVSFDGQGEYATICLPYSHKYDREKQALIRGYLDHECGHINYTPRSEREIVREFAAVDWLEDRQAYKIFNLFEDVRIEKLTARAFPGAAKNFRVSRSILMGPVDPGQFLQDTDTLADYFDAAAQVSGKGKGALLRQCDEALWHTACTAATNYQLAKNNELLYQENYYADQFWRVVEWIVGKGQSRFADTAAVEKYLTGPCGQAKLRGLFDAAAVKGNAAETWQETCAAGRLFCDALAALLKRLRLFDKTNKQIQNSMPDMSGQPGEQSGESGEQSGQSGEQPGESGESGEQSGEQSGQSGESGEQSGQPGEQSGDAPDLLPGSGQRMPADLAQKARDRFGNVDGVHDLNDRLFAKVNEGQDIAGSDQEIFSELLQTGRSSALYENEPAKRTLLERDIIRIQAGTLLRPLLQAKTLVRAHVGNIGARLSFKDLYRPACRDGRIFKTRAEKLALDTDIIMLLDISSSMSNCIEKTAAALSGLAAAVSALPGIRVAQATYTSIGGVNIRVPFGQTEKVFKYPVCGGCTPTAGAILQVARLFDRPAARKMLFVFTDGEPDHKFATIATIRRTEARGIECYGIGIGSGLRIGDLFSRSIQVEDLREFPARVRDMLRQALIG